MAGAGPMTSQHWRTKLVAERYVREWLVGKPRPDTSLLIRDTEINLPNEQAMALAVENSPAFIPVPTKSCPTIMDEPIGARPKPEKVRRHEQTALEGTERPPR